MGSVAGRSVELIGTFGVAVGSYSEYFVAHCTAVP